MAIWKDIVAKDTTQPDPAPVARPRPESVPNAPTAVVTASRKELKETWHALKICGVCGLEQEMGIAADGDILYVN